MSTDDAAVERGAFALFAEEHSHIEAGLLKLMWDAMVTRTKVQYLAYARAVIRAAASPTGAPVQEGGAGALTIRDAQTNQPWTVPYADGVEVARASGLVPHILASHCVLHASKTVGKLAAVFEAMDHPLAKTGQGPSAPTGPQLATVKAMSADLATEALRFANLYGFDLATELLARRAEKNPAVAPPLSPVGTPPPEREPLLYRVMRSWAAPASPGETPLTTGASDVAARDQVPGTIEQSPESQPKTPECRARFTTGETPPTGTCNGECGAKPAVPHVHGGPSTEAKKP